MSERGYKCVGEREKERKQVEKKRKEDRAGQGQDRSLEKDKKKGIIERDESTSFVSFLYGGKEVERKREEARQSEGQTETKRPRQKKYNALFYLESPRTKKLKCVIRIGK